MIPPGEAGFVNINMDTTQLQGKTVKSVHVKTSDPEQSALVLTLRANILGSVETFPGSVIYMRSRVDHPPVARSLIRQDPTESGTLAVSGVRVDDPRFVASASKLESPTPRGQGLPGGRTGDWLLEVRFREDKPIYGKLKTKVHFETGLTRQPRKSLEVESNLEGAISLSTPRLSLTPFGNGESRGTVFASIREGADASAIRAVAQPPGLQVQLQRTTERLVKAEVRWPGGPLRNGSVKFEIDGETVQLPVILSAGND